MCAEPACWMPLIVYGTFHLWLASSPSGIGHAIVSQTFGIHGLVTFQSPEVGLAHKSADIERKDDFHKFGSIFLDG